jgi:hypothetical protein
LEAGDSSSETLICPNSDLTAVGTNLGERRRPSGKLVRRLKDRRSMDVVGGLRNAVTTLLRPASLGPWWAAGGWNPSLRHPTESSERIRRYVRAHCGGGTIHRRNGPRTSDPGSRTAHN